MRLDTIFSTNSATNCNTCRIRIINMRKRYKPAYQSLFVIPLLLAAGCTTAPVPGSVEYALNAAGPNRTEMERVLDHYSDNPEKLAAAAYLISSMPFHGSRRGPGLDRYREYYALFSKSGIDALPIVDSLQRLPEAFSADRLRLSLDINDISDEYLIHHIDRSFKTRDNTPWGRQIDFDVFLRYILPYRIKNEEPEAWLDSLDRKWMPVRDSLAAIPEMRDPVKAALAVARKWNEKKFHWTGKLPEGPGIGVCSVNEKAGTCLEFAHGLIYLLRWFGLPATIDMVSVRGTNNSRHFWPVMPDADGTVMVAATEYPEFVNVAGFDIYAAKIFRSEFGVNKDYLTYAREGTELPPQFAVPLIRDVTADYYAHRKRCFDLTFNLEDCGDDPVLLGVSRYRDWMPVDVVDPEDGKATFRNVRGGVVAVAGRMKHGRLLPLTPPFVVDSLTGALRTIVPSKETHRITLYSKFTVNRYNSDFVERLADGRIEGANRPDFSDAVTLHTIREYPYRKFGVAAIDSAAGPFRYVRYIGADSTWCDIAELTLYASAADTVPLTGRAFGTPGLPDDAGLHLPRFAWDGNTLTSFHAETPSGGWTAIDLGKPRRIAKAVYTGRNRDNYINRGTVYELFWYDNGRWISAGKRKAEADSVVFDVPQDALYYLKSHGGGKQERIFEYDSRRCPPQIWW